MNRWIIMSSERGDDIPREVFTIDGARFLNGAVIPGAPVQKNSQRIYSDETEAVEVARRIVEVRVAKGDPTPLDVIEWVRGPEHSLFITLWSSAGQP